MTAQPTVAGRTAHRSADKRTSHTTTHGGGSNKNGLTPSSLIDNHAEKTLVCEYEAGAYLFIRETSAAAPTRSASQRRRRRRHPNGKYPTAVPSHPRYQAHLPLLLSINTPKSKPWRFLCHLRKPAAAAAPPGQGRAAFPAPPCTTNASPVLPPQHEEEAATTRRASSKPGAAGNDIIGDLFRGSQNKSGKERC